MVGFGPRVVHVPSLNEIREIDLPTMSDFLRHLFIYLKLNSLELATWAVRGGGRKFGSTLAVLALISLSWPWLAWPGGGGGDGC